MGLTPRSELSKVPITVTTLSKRDVQLFMKRLRKYQERFKDDSRYNTLRYYLTGEYGTKTKRAHYHVLLFNAFPETIEACEHLWGKGSVHIGDLNDNTIRYVSNYMLTKNIDCYENQERPFSLMSRRPAIGFDYVSQNWSSHMKNASHKFKLPTKSRPNLPRTYEKYVILPEDKELVRKNKEVEYNAFKTDQLQDAEKKCPEDPLGYIREQKAHKEKIKLYRAKKRKL